MVLSWSPPDCIGGTPITRFIVDYKLASVTDWEDCERQFSSEKMLKVTGLQPSTGYQFRIAAENKCGVGHFATESDVAMTLGKECK